MPAVRRIGHKGADLIAPGNTLASFEAALAVGVDMIEFDVLPANHDGTGELYLAHDYKHLHGDAPTLAEGLAHFAGEAYAGVELDVDLKLPGYEARVCEALREHGLADRALISTGYTDSLALVRATAPEIRVGWSVPQARHDYVANVFTRPIALLAVQWARRVIPPRAAAMIREGRIDAVMSHWYLVTPAFAKTISDAGGELYVWTVDDAKKIRELEQMPGVTGIITNDPRLFIS
jgi:glycerophosphoryl diester phosphodiesterase